MSVMLFSAGALLFSVFVGYLYLPRIILIAKKKRLFDTVNVRKVHRGFVPRIGGIAFFPIILLTLTIFTIIRCCVGIPAFTLSSRFFIDVLCLLYGLTIIFIIGVADDLAGVRYKIKFLFQFFAALSVIPSRLWLHDFYGIMGIHEVSPLVGIPVTILIVMFVINAYNLIDGIDGLCAGLSLMAIGFIGGLFLYCGYFFFGVIAAGIMGVLAVFFIFNISGKKYKVFMGDTGSLTLGFIIIFMCLEMLSLFPHNDVLRIIKNPVAVFAGLLFVPVFDTFRVFTVRISCGFSPFYPDKRHIHHKFLELGFTHASATLAIMATQLIFFIMNVLLQQLNVNAILAIDITLGLIYIYMLDNICSKRKLN